MFGSLGIITGFWAHHCKINLRPLETTSKRGTQLQRPSMNRSVIDFRHEDPIRSLYRAVFRSFKQPPFADKQKDPETATRSCRRWKKSCTTWDVLPILWRNISSIDSMTGSYGFIFYKTDSRFKIETKNQPFLYKKTQNQPFLLVKIHPRKLTVRSTLKNGMFGRLGLAFESFSPFSGRNFGWIFGVGLVFKVRIAGFSNP